MCEPELQLFVLWEKSRHLEEKILADMARHLEIVHRRELVVEGDARDFYRRFYSFRSIDGARKVRNCGRGPFLLVVVRDPAPEHFTSKLGNPVNRTVYDLKAKYRTWVGRGFRVHATLNATEFGRDILALTGHAADEWAQGVPVGAFSMRLPPLDAIPPPLGLGARLKAHLKKLFGPRASARGLPKPVLAAWWDVINGAGAELGLSDCRLTLENKLVNDAFFEGRFQGVPCIVKCSSRAPASILNEYASSRRLFAADGRACAEPLAQWTAPNGRRAFVVTRRLEGPSLAALCAAGLSEAQADACAEDIARLAEALKKADLVHRDLFEDNLLLDADGHLRAIDLQFAVRRTAYCEDAWMRRHWKYRYVVFGVNRDLGLGVWNDFRALDGVLARFPQTERVAAVRRALAAEAPAMAVSAPPDARDRFRLRLYAVSLRLQMFLRGRAHRKYAQLARRYRTIRGTALCGADALSRGGYAGVGGV